MPNTENAKKRHRQSLVRRARNRAVKSMLRGHIRKLKELIVTGDLEKCVAEDRLLVKKLDKAAAHNVIHANQAARLKSRMSAAIKRVKHAKQVAPANPA